MCVFLKFIGFPVGDGYPVALWGMGDYGQSHAQ